MLFLNRKLIEFSSSKFDNGDNISKLLNDHNYRVCVVCNKELKYKETYLYSELFCRLASIELNIDCPEVALYRRETFSESCDRLMSKDFSNRIMVLKNVYGCAIGENDDCKRTVYISLEHNKDIKTLINTCFHEVFHVYTYKHFGDKLPEQYKQALEKCAEFYGNQKGI